MERWFTESVGSRLGKRGDLFVPLQLLHDISETMIEVHPNLVFDLLAGAFDGVLGKDLTQSEVFRCAVPGLILDDVIF